MTLKLDENQQKAVEHFEGPALVVAGPGSGKTTVIIERILNLIRENRINSHQFLAVAFNRKAAREMEQRLSAKLAKLGVYPYYAKPEICTLHAFGRRIIVNNHGRLNFKKAPSTWKAFALEITIKGEVAKLNREKANTEVTIYKVSSKKTGRCYYIGQTTNLQRRKEEHLTDSSNSHLRQVILAEGEESVTFIPIDWVEGRFADKHEEEWIAHYKSLTVFNSEFENEAVEEEIIGLPFTIYKIESKITGRCYVGYTTDPGWIEQDFGHISNDALQEAIEDEGEEQFIFEILHKEVPGTEAAQRVADEIEAHKNRAVFNHSNPLSQRYSDRLLIELFCDHFNICYEELLKRPSDIENFADKIKDFEKMASNIDKVKREVNLDFSNINSIDDIINAIIGSIDDLVVRAFAEKYEQKKRKANAIDFQDMIIYATYLLETHPDIRKNYCEKYQYVFVDEFQDISFADFRLIKLLPENLFAVGDDDQAIYGFRGGNSEIMQDFRKREDVKKYKITRNYRSTSIIVKHSKTLMEHNLNRISKNLHAKNLATYPPVKTLETSTTETLERTFLREFPEPICQTQLIDDRVSIFENTLLEVDIETQTIGILARYRSEVEKLRKLLAKGFKEIKEDAQRKEGDPFSFVGRSLGEIIEGGTIHSAKGKEYDKVILIHNTLEDKDFPFHDSDDINEDRRVFYVAMTRAKRELVILGGECQFVAEAGLSALPSKRRKHLERIYKTLQPAITKRIDIAKKQVNELSEKLQITLTSILIKYMESTIESTRKQCKYELEQLRRKANKTEKAAEDAAKRLKSELPTAIQVANETFLEELIPVLDEFELQIKNLPATVESNSGLDDFSVFTERVRRAHDQLLDLLKTHELKPIEAVSEIFNPTYHEKVSSDIYSSKAQAGKIGKEERRGYLLRDEVIRKAEVVVSKGQNIRTSERLDRVVEIYLDRLIASRFGPKYDLDKSTIRRKMTKYLTELDEKSLKKINSAATIDPPQYIKEQPLGNYCVGRATAHMCTDIVFRNFWKYMWEVVEQSRKTPKPKIKRTQPSADKPPHTPKTRESTSVERPTKIADQTSIWDELTTTHETGIPVEGHIIERIKGGLRVSVGSLQGFLPASQVELHPIQNLEQYVGQTLDMKVINLNRQRHNIVLSRRLWLEEQKIKLLNTFKVGQYLNGVVKNITDFGAFVDLGGIDGLLHKSEMAWKRVNQPSEIVSVGEEIKVKVIELDREKEKISLSLKRVTSDPWENIEHKYPIGSKVSGVVVNIVDYGAFVQLEEGIVGLIHVSEMPLVLNNVSPLDILNKDDELEVTVLEIFKDSQRISLSIK